MIKEVLSLLLPVVSLHAQHRDRSVYDLSPIIQHVGRAYRLSMEDKSRMRKETSHQIKHEGPVTDGTRPLPSCLSDGKNRSSEMVGEAKWWENAMRAIPEPSGLRRLLVDLHQIPSSITRWMSEF